MPSRNGSGSLAQEYETPFTGSDFLTSKQMNSLRALRFSSLREKVKSRTRPSFSLIDI